MAETPNSPTSTEFVSNDFNILDQPVNEKTYSKPNFAASGDMLNQPIGEPSFAPPPIGKERPYQQIKPDDTKSGGQSQQTATNPSLNDVSDEEKKMAAEHMADLIIDGYDQLNMFADKGLQFNEGKINKLVQEGEIDLGIPIPYDMGKTMTGRDVIKEFNAQTKGTFKVTDKFKQEVRPPLVRVLKKRGAGLSDEQFLIYAFGKDIALKTVTFFQIRQEMKNVVETMKEMTMAYREAGGSAAGSYSESNYQQPNPEPQAQHTFHNEEAESGYSQKFQEPEEHITPPDFGNPETMELIEKTAAGNEKQKGKRRQHFSNKRKSQSSSAEDAQIIDDENELD